MTSRLTPLPLPELTRPDWMAEANCRNVPTSAFFPPAGQPSAKAQRLIRDVCGPCPVAHHCLLYAVEHNCAGIWAGTTGNDRRGIDHPRRRRTS